MIKSNSIGLRLTHAEKLRLQREAELNKTTLSKQILKHIDKVSVTLANKNSDPQVVKTAEMLEEALRLLTKIKKVELAKTGEGNWTAERKAFEYAKAILGFAENLVNNKPMDATLRAIRQVKLNQEIKRIR